jgi:hypothetical protein
VLKKGKGHVFVLVPWAVNELALLLREYYYVLTVLPQFMLNFRLRNVEKGTLVRVVLLAVLAWVKVHSICFSSQISIFLSQKEGNYELI